MMRKLLLSAAVAGTLLGSCTTTGQFSPAILVADVQQDAIAICSFLPTVSTVANIIAAGNPLLTTAEAVAQAICSAVTAAPVVAPPVAGARRRAARSGPVGTPTVAGVVIKGNFIH